MLVLGVWSSWGRGPYASTTSGGIRAAPVGLPSSRRKLNVAHALGWGGVHHMISHDMCMTLLCLGPPN